MGSQQQRKCIGSLIVQASQSTQSIQTSQSAQSIQSISNDSRGRGMDFISFLYVKCLFSHNNNNNNNSIHNNNNIHTQTHPSTHTHTPHSVSTPSALCQSSDSRNVAFALLLQLCKFDKGMMSIAILEKHYILYILYIHKHIHKHIHIYIYNIISHINYIIILIRYIHTHAHIQQRMHLDLSTSCTHTPSLAVN